MGICCNLFNNIKNEKEEQFSPENDNKMNNSQEKAKFQISSVSDGKRYLTESSQQIVSWRQQKNSILENDNISMVKPDKFNEILLDNNKIQNPLNVSLMNETELGLNITDMERKLFDLINELRSNPQSFIDYILKYKDMIKNEKDINYIIIDDITFEIKNGEKCFDECINYLKEQNGLKKFEISPTMFECKKSFINKNVSDLVFVLVYNLIDINSDQDNNFKRNCIMSNEYNRLNITITKDEIGNKLYSYYFSFD